jgi:hypothetical protein
MIFGNLDFRGSWGFRIEGNCFCMGGARTDFENQKFGAEVRMCGLRGTL